MLNFKSFAGINNVVPSERLIHDKESKSAELAAATNVDIGLSGEIRRRAGFTELLGTCHKNLHQADGFILATVDGGDLISMDATGGNRVTLYPSLGVSRVWYCNLPDGRTTFSNGLINGVTDGTVATTWGVPIPPSIGTLTPVAGSLFPGDYQYQITYVRLSDGAESGPAYSNPIAVPNGGVVLTGLPVLDDHKINVYLTSHNGEHGFYAGSTTNGAFSFTGKNDTLIVPCRTDFLYPAPAGTVQAFYKGRVLIAVGPTLYASRPGNWELFDIRRDFKQFSADVTLLQPVDDGVYVGTTDELVFMAGDEFDKMTYRKVAGPAVLGSGVAVRGELIKQGEGAGLGSAMLCIADNVVCAGFNSGNVVRLTEGRYKTSVAEVSATFRMVDRIPQYVAVPQ